MTAVARPAHDEDNRRAAAADLVVKLGPLTVTPGMASLPKWPPRHVRPTAVPAQALPITAGLDGEGGPRQQRDSNSATTKPHQSSTGYGLGGNPSFVVG
jgi:hypothetical protein